MTAPDAHRQALAESRFFAHLTAFALGAAVLAAVALAAPGAGRWAGWIGAVWTVAVAMHGLTTFWPFGDDWVARRVGTLRGGVHGGDVYALIDRALQAHAMPEGTAAAVRDLQARVETLEGSPRRARRAPALPQPSAPGAADPFDLGAAGAVGRPLTPAAIGVPTDPLDDLFSVPREPIDTPRLDTPRARSGQAAEEP